MDFPDRLDSNARVGVRKGTGTTYERRRISLIEGTNVSFTVADDPTSEEVDVTVAVASAAPSGSAGGDLTGTYPNPSVSTSILGGAAWTVVTKSGDESVTSSTTLQDDDHLSFATVSGASYEVEFFLVYASPLGAGTPDMKIAVGEDTTIRGAHTVSRIVSTDAGGSGTALLGDLTDVATLGTSAAKRTARSFGSHQGAGGTFKLQWAQNTSDANPTTLYTGSLLRYRRIV